MKIALNKVRLPPNPHRIWEERQVRDMLDQMFRRVGGGWPYFAPEIREAFVAEAAFAVVRQDRNGEISVASANCLYSDMRALAPIYEERS